ncbi:MAG: hypothetical protein ABIH35_02035 [Patescibacteria group bacterium]
MNTKQLERIENFTLNDYSDLCSIIAFSGYRFRAALKIIFKGENCTDKDALEFKRKELFLLFSE